MTPTTEIMRTLAWSLLHFLWQGAAIAAVAAAFMFVFRKPATRYLVGIAALALMLVSFGITFTLISGSHGVAAEASAAGAPAAASLSTLGANASSTFHLGEQAAISSDGGFLWIARGWLAGVFLFALRIAFGLLVIDYLRRRNLIALPDALVDRFRALQRRLGIRRNVRYAECHSLSVPAVVGFFRPIVLLPMRALTGLTPEQLEAVIAHELGHIKRFDVAVNFFQVIAETLFFFHPAVWWLNKRIRADREDCCDDVAIAVCGEKAGYARALATMEGWRDVPDFALAATGGSVAARVARLLGVSERNANTRTAGVFTASLVLTAALSAGAISLGMVEPAEARDYIGAEPVLLAQAEPKPAPAPKKPNPASKPNPAQKPAPAPNPQNKPSNNPANANSPGNSYIAQMKAAGYNDLDVDQLVAMRVHGITPEYVKGVRDMGFTPDPDQVIAMKVHDISPEYVRSEEHTSELQS